MQLPVLMVLFCAFWGGILWLAFGNGKVADFYRKAHKSEEEILENTGIYLICCGLVVVILIGVLTHHSTMDLKVENNKTLEGIEQPYLKVEDIRILHNVKIATDPKYINSSLYSVRENMLEKHGADMKARKKDVAEIKHNLEKEYQSKLVIASSLSLLIASLTFGLGGSLVGRGLSERLRKKCEIQKNSKIR